MNIAIKVSTIAGVKEIPLTKERMDTLKRYFVQKRGVYYFSAKKKEEYITKLNK